MKDIKFNRKNHLIIDMNGNVVFTGEAQRTINGAKFPSNNAAKRESVRLQAMHGQGCVRNIS